MERFREEGLNPDGADAETIRRGAEMYRMLARELPNVAVVAFDRSLRVLVAEGEALLSHGIVDTAAEGRLLADVMTPETYAAMEAVYLAALRGVRTDREQQADDGERCFRVIGKPMIDDGGEVWAGLVMAQDITDLRADAKVLRAQATRLTDIAERDDLTHLPRRALLGDRLEQALARAARDKRIFALLALDIDGFKNVNDTLGHEAGDQLLRAVAGVLEAAVRAVDTVARLGGDEFVILVDDIEDATDALAAVERLFGALRSPIRVVGSELAVTVSVGIALAPQDGSTPAELLAAADRAMYLAKAGRGNHHRFFDPAMHALALERLQTQAAIQDALRRDEFFLHYQPVVDLETGRVVSVEALIRWNHPERGLLSPAAFIPLAEETDLILDITTWVLRRACAQAVAWERAGIPPLRVAVNSCARDLTMGLRTAIEAALQASGLTPERLEIEVTERLLGTDDVVRGEMLADLRRLGVRIALDDFGTGYSSLARLRSFPVDVIKIDRMFIAELDKTPAIASTIIALATNLGLTVIAEGVERGDQLAWLESGDCDAASGFFICPPLPAEELTPWLLARSWSERSVKMPQADA
jgi:diguanylate cyclase (GGDEF)-like protein